MLPGYPAPGWATTQVYPAQLLRPWIPNPKRWEDFCPRSDRFRLLELHVF